MIYLNAQICNNVYCIVCDSDKNNKQINIYKCYLTFCDDCFKQLPTMEKLYLDGICKNC